MKKIVFLNETDVYRAYATQRVRYSFLDRSFENISLSVSIDLLMFFDDWIKKYSFKNVISQFYRYDQNFGNLFNLSVMNVLKYFFDNNFETALTTTRQNNSEFYWKTQIELKINVLLNNCVVIIDCSDSNCIKFLIQIIFDHKFVIVKKNFSTILSLFCNFYDFNFNVIERVFFKQYKYHIYYIDFFNNFDISDIFQLQNIGKV